MSAVNRILDKALRGERLNLEDTVTLLRVMRLRRLATRRM